MVRPCTMRPAAPARDSRRATRSMLTFFSLSPVRTLTLTGSSHPLTTPCTSLASERGLRSITAPSPRLDASCMGQPTLMSSQSAPDCCANAPAATPSLMTLVATWKPYSGSLAALASRARSTRSPLSSGLANAISLIVTSHPNSAHSRLKGRLPPLVRGANTSFPRILSPKAFRFCNRASGTGPNRASSSSCTLKLEAASSLFSLGSVAASTSATLVGRTIDLPIGRRTCLVVK
mmetsp:Transcript_16719/g.41821  ORF Transcript_16719/g.41821 Transcript_16719/m.41821 type:complete len:234 (-) Transcript_16719:309-1010(-)